MSQVLAYIGLGSNLQDPLDQVSRALATLSRLPDSRGLGRSSLYASPPMGPPDQPDYINAVACLETGLSPHALLDALQAIEQDHSRVRDGASRWGPRTLDLDILLYGDREIHDPDLRVPHGGLHERPFVLYPLAEIAPADLVVPGMGTLSELLSRCPRDGLRRLEDHA
ncbi:MAG: 2-amino-4-hydroxy-6-hydroxymethyldihydropteridine diphosphokinase [Thioalkalivibrio sp.]